MVSQRLGGTGLVGQKEGKSVVQDPGSKPSSDL